MMRTRCLLLMVSLALSACGTMQSIVRASFPYTANVVIPAATVTDKESSAVSTATSFDQSFADKINAVRIISAKVEAAEPTDLNIGRFAYIEVYVSKADGKDEEMVASRKDINPNVGNSLVLDIDNAHFLDELVRQPSLRVRVAYKLRDKISANVNLHIVLNIAAYPNRE